ncbi:MAG: hypothetical protein Q4G35_02935 [Propionibacteriaceae bacterium]|nr:hypothetical protein [Propionibacteriaceae bacterium]
MTGYDTSLQRAMAGAGELRAGTWESVEALALLAIESRDKTFLQSAQDAARSLKG